MPSFINADNGVVSGSAGVKTTADTSGELALQSNGTTGLTLNTSLAIGVGSGNSRGTSGQVLTSAGSAAAPTWQTPTVTAPAGTTGQVQINNAGAFGAVGSGTTGQVLTSQGAGAAPVFATPAAGGSWVFLSAVTASNSATVDVESTFDSTYDAYAIIATNVTPANVTDLYVRLRIGGTYLTAGYAYTTYSTRSNTTTGQLEAINNSNDAQIFLAENITNNATLAGSAANFSLFLHNPSSGSMIKSIYTQGTFIQQGSSVAQAGAMNASAINRSNVSALTGVRIFCKTGNVSTGTFRLYGIKNS